MTHIDHLRIKGFKTVEQLEVDPSQINIITGRNNSGKTSVLESLDILFNPVNISKYGPNANNLINAKRNSCSISGTYSQAQTTIQEWQSEGKSNQQREVGLREPRRQETVEIFYEVLQEILDLNEEYPLGPFISSVQAQSVEISGLEELLRETLRETVSNLSTQEIAESGASNNIVIIEINGETYPLIYLGQFYDELRDELTKRSITNLNQKEEITDLKEAIELADADHLEMQLEHSYDRLLTPRFGRARFIGDEPPELPGLDFISKVEGNAEQFDLDKENAAVQVSKIEQYLIENNILDNLQDFSFNKVVFEEEEEDAAYEVPYEFLGEGVKIIIRVLWAIFNEDIRGDVLLLEEPENHMHPGYIENLVNQLVEISRERDIQLFITTHNLDFIGSFFSPQMDAERENYLEKGFKLIQLTGGITKTMNYSQAKEKRDDLDLDLRGV